MTNFKLLQTFTEPTNYKIMKTMLEASEGVSISEISKKLNISRTISKYRLNKFAKLGYCKVNLDIPKLETQRPTKSYTLIYMFKPIYRKKLNIFADKIEAIIHEEN